jgi:hypothetical protein
MDPVTIQLVISSSGLIGAAGDLSNKVKGLVRGTGSLDPETVALLEADLVDAIKFATECTAALALAKKK